MLDGRYRPIDGPDTLAEQLKTIDPDVTSNPALGKMSLKQLVARYVAERCVSGAGVVVAFVSPARRTMYSRCL